MNASFMRLERHERGIHVIEKPAGPGSAVAGVHKRFCGTTGTAADEHASSRSKWLRGRAER